MAKRLVRIAFNFSPITVVVPDNFDELPDKELALKVAVLASLDDGDIDVEDVTDEEPE